MNSSLYNELKTLSDTNYEPKVELREEHAREKDQQYVLRDEAMSKAADELFQEIVTETLMTTMRNKANDGYYETLLFAVSLDPSMDSFATHEPGKPFVITEYNNDKYTFTYRSLFWSPKWKELFGGFQLNYRWNKPQTLLSVYISWIR